MSNSYFYDNKLKYENIEIPKELEFMVNRTLKKGREKRRIKTIYKFSSFNVPIKLESQIFNSQLRDVKGISTNLIIK